MRIEITSLLSETPDATYHISLPAHHVLFTSSSVSGQACFITSQGHDEIQNKVFYVECGFQSMKNYQRYSHEENISCAIVPVTPAGNYDVIATIVRRDTTSNSCVAAVTRELEFVLDMEELQSTLPEVGCFVSFHVHQLVLWDENV